MEFSLEKEDQKKENGFMQPIIPVYGLCNLFINSIRIFFIYLKMFIMQQKKQLR